jgi:hypothetical protein
MKKWFGVVSVLIILIVAGGVAALRRSSASEAPAQPVAFDHWQHVTKPEGPQLDCTFCHENADKSSHATIPSSSKTCMTCHESIKTDSPEVQKLAAYSASGKQPPWARVYWIDKDADVYFTHKPHIRAGVDCSACHGNVGEMHRVRRVVNQAMGWCVDCHRERRVSVDCYICHR